MVDLGRVGRRLWWLLVRSVEIVLALVVLVAVLVLGDLPTGPDAPEQTATISIPFLVVWGLTTVLLLALVGVRALFEGSRLVGDDPGALRRRAGRAAAETLFGFVAVATLELVPVAAGGFATVLAATAAVAWAVVVHHFVDALLFGWSLLASE